MIENIIISNFLSPEECKIIIKLIDENQSKRKNFLMGKNYQTITLDDRFLNLIEPKVLKYLPNNLLIDDKKYTLIGLSDHITLSKHSYPINKHIDAKTNPLFKGKQLKNGITLLKVGIYLNDLSDLLNPKDKTGGTIFFDKKGDIIEEIKPEIGKMFIFDIRKSHSGSFFKNSIKYMVGFRILYELIE